MNAPLTVRVPGCNKVGWLDKNDARTHRRRRFPNDHMRVYLCEHCAAVIGRPVFHLGHRAKESS